MDNPSRLAHIRPLSIAEMLDRVMAVFAARRLLFISLSMLFVAPDAAIAWLLWIRAGHYTTTDSIIVVALVIIANWAAALSLIAAFQNMLVPGREMAWRAMAGVALTRLPGFFLTRFLCQAIVVSLALLIPRAIISSGPVGALAALGMVVTGGVLHLRWALVPVVVLIEEEIFFKAMRRSTYLMTRARPLLALGDSALWRYLAVCILPVLLFVGGGVLFWLCVQDSVMQPTAASLRHQKLALLGGANAVGLLLASGLYWVGLVFVYAEIRNRREGMDLLFRVLEARTSHPDLK